MLLAPKIAFTFSLSPALHCRGDEELQDAAAASLSDTISPVFVACKCGIAAPAAALVQAVKDAYLPDRDEHRVSRVFPFRAMDGSVVKDPPLPQNVSTAATEVHRVMHELASRYGWNERFRC